MNKFIKITLGSSLCGLILATFFLWYGQYANFSLKTVDVKPVWLSASPPPMNISPLFLFLLGFFLLAFFGLRKKNL